MKKIFIVLATLLITGGLAYAQETILVEWDPPTHRVQNNDFEQQGTPLTQEQINSLEYTLSYRPAGTATWTNVETTVPSANVTLSGYSITYEFSVGAKFPGGTILCATPLVTYQTGPDESPPGQCSDPRITKQ